MTPAATTEKHTTKCKYCKQAFKAFTFGTPAADQPPPERLIKFIMALGAHIASHKDEYQKLAGTLQEFSGLLIMNEFETDDPGLLARIDAIRSSVHQQSAKHFMNDEDLQTLVDRLGPQPAPETVLEILTQMRDLYEELGDWTPAARPETVELPV